MKHNYLSAMKNITFPNEFQYILNFYNKFYPCNDIEYCGNSDIPDFLTTKYNEVQEALPFNKAEFINDSSLQLSIEKMKLDPDSLYEFLCFIYIHTEFTEFVSVIYRQKKIENQKKKFRELMKNQLNDELIKTKDRSLKDNIAEFFNFKHEIYNGNPIKIKTDSKVSRLRQEYIITTTYTSRLKQFMIINNIEAGIPQYNKSQNVKYTSIEREFYLRILNFIKYIIIDSERHDILIDFGGTFNALQRDFELIESSLSVIDKTIFQTFLENRNI